VGTPMLHAIPVNKLVVLPLVLEVVFTEDRGFSTVFPLYFSHHGGGERDLKGGVLFQSSQQGSLIFLTFYVIYISTSII
jgi:hypothetical protein